MLNYYGRNKPRKRNQMVNPPHKLNDEKHQTTSRLLFEHDMDIYTYMPP